MSDTIIAMLDSTATHYVNAGKSESDADFAAVGSCLNGLVSALIEIGQSGADLTNGQLAMLVDGLLQTLTWMTAKDLSRQAWSEVGEDFPFDDGV